MKFLPPCFLSLFLPSSFINTSWSKRDNFLFSRAPFSRTESKGSEDTLFKQSSLAGISAEFIACADLARFKLPLTGSEVTSGISSFYKNTINKDNCPSLLPFIALTKNQTEMKFQSLIMFTLLLMSQHQLLILKPWHKNDFYQYLRGPRHQADLRCNEI